VCVCACVWGGGDRGRRQIGREKGKGGQIGSGKGKGVGGRHGEEGGLLCQDQDTYNICWARLVHHPKTFCSCCIPFSAPPPRLSCMFYLSCLCTPPPPPRYFTEGADEVAFLNITGFRDCPLEDLPMLGVSESGNESEGEGEGVRESESGKCCRSAGRLQLYACQGVVGVMEMGLGGRYVLFSGGRGGGLQPASVSWQVWPPDRLTVTVTVGGKGDQEREGVRTACLCSSSNRALQEAVSRPTTSLAPLGSTCLASLHLTILHTHAPAAY